MLSVEFLASKRKFGHKNTRSDAVDSPHPRQRWSPGKRKKKVVIQHRFFLGEGVEGVEGGVGWGEGGVGFGLEIEMARNIFSTLFPAARSRTTTAKLERRLGCT